MGPWCTLNNGRFVASCSTAFSYTAEDLQPPRWRVTKGAVKWGKARRADGAECAADCAFRCAPKLKAPLIRSALPHSIFGIWSLRFRKVVDPSLPRIISKEERQSCQNNTHSSL